MRPFDLIHTPFSMTKGQLEGIWHDILSRPTRLYEVLGCVRVAGGPGFYAQSPIVVCYPDSITFMFKQEIDRAVTILGLNLFVEDKFDILPKVYQKTMVPSYDRGLDGSYMEEYNELVPQYLMLADSPFERPVAACAGDTCYLTHRELPA